MKIILQSMKFHVEFLCIVHRAHIFVEIKTYVRGKDFFVNREQNFSYSEFSFTENCLFQMRFNEHAQRFC